MADYSHLHPTMVCNKAFRNGAHPNTVHAKAGKHFQLCMTEGDINYADFGITVLVVDSWLAWSGVGPVLSSDTDPLFSTRPPHCLTVS